MKKNILIGLIILFISLACRLSLLDGASISINRSEQSESETPLPTSTQTQRPPTQTATSTPIPEAGVIDLEIYGVDWIGSGDLLLTFSSSKPIEDALYLILGSARFNCRIANDSNQLLFCVGRDAAPGQSIPAVLHLMENDLIVFESLVSVPGQSSPAQSGGSGSLTQVPTIPAGPTSPAPTP